jgi:hypothetical protein
MLFSAVTYDFIGTIDRDKAECEVQRPAHPEFNILSSRFFDQGVQQ